MQCRSHSRRRTSECLFVTACSMDEYAEEKRTEKNLIVRSSISEAETTNNKRLRSTFCIEAIQTRSIARPLCDNRAFCYVSTGRRIEHATPSLSCRERERERERRDRRVVVYALVTCVRVHFKYDFCQFWADLPWQLTTLLNKPYFSLLYANSVVKLLQTSVSETIRKQPLAKA